MNMAQPSDVSRRSAEIQQRKCVCRATGCVMETSTGSDERAHRLKELADALMADYMLSYQLDTVQEAIYLYEKLLHLQPLGHQRHDEAVSDLGDALFYFCHFNGTHDARARQSLDLLREAVQLRPLNHPLRDQSLHNLARALLFVGYEQGSGDMTALIECIQLNREALQLRAVGHPERAESLNSLAVSLMRLFECCGDPTVMTECIAMNREALQLWKPGHPRRHASLNNLAVGLYQFAAFQGGLEVLAEADSLLREALDLRPPGHPLRSGALDNLAGSLKIRYELQALPAALLEAVALRRDAWNMLPVSHPEWGRRTENLAEILIVDFRYRRDMSSITEAITLLRRALVLRPLGSSFRHHSLQSLAEALLVQFDECGDTACLLEAIPLHREVLDLRPSGHTLRPEALHRLGRLLSKPECQCWPEALALFLEAAESCHAGHPSRSSLLSDMNRCFLDPGSPFFDLSKGISNLFDLYSNELSHVNQRLRHAISDLRQVEAAYMSCMRCANTSTTDHYSGCILQLYVHVIGLLPRVANLGLDHKTRLQVIAGSDEIARNAAARALLLGCTSQAIELLDEGRGIFWSQTLQLRATGFDNIPKADRENLVRLLRMLEHGARTAESSGQTVTQRERALERRRQLNTEVEALIARIRAYPGCTRFLMAATFDSLLKGLPDGFVVILNGSKLGHHALLLHKNTRVAASLALELPSTGFDWTALRARLPRDVGAQSEHDDKNHRAMRLNNGHVSSFENVLSQLWTSMAHPVIRKLGLEKEVRRNRPRLWWCVTGELSFLPIHAAGQYQDAHSGCTSDYAVSSYIPTLSSLTKARMGWKPLPRTSIAGLLICETYTDHGSARHLPGAEREALIVRDCFGSANAQVLNAYSPHTSIAELRSLLQDKAAHVLHLACHGVQDADPLSSALMMQDGRLSIEDLLQMSLPQAVLAYLSACQTAKGDRNAPDQAVHLAASMLFCGFRSVIGTMWLMHDEDGPRLARRFYEALFKKETLDLDDIAYALDEAIQDLRIQGVPAQRWALFMHMGG